MQPMFQHLGICIRNARKERTLTQAQLSALCGISTRHIANIEKGVMNPTFEVLLKLIRQLSISADALFCPDLQEREKRIKIITSSLALCTDEDQEIIVKTVQCMAHEFYYRRPPTLL